MMLGRSSTMSRALGASPSTLTSRSPSVVSRPHGGPTPRWRRKVSLEELDCNSLYHVIAGLFLHPGRQRRQHLAEQAQQGLITFQLCINVHVPVASGARHQEE